MEASLRFAGGETVATKIFGRLFGLAELDLYSAERDRRAWRAERYGSGAKAQFDWERCSPREI